MCKEHVDIQTLVAEPSVETFDETILNGFPWPNKIQLDPVTIRPGIHDATGEFAAIVYRAPARRATLEHHGVRGRGHLLPREGLIGEQAQTFALN
jgi:hypothetical protein